MKEDINDILNLIEEAKREEAYSVKLENGQEAKFVPMTAESQKQLIKALVDSPFYSNSFEVVINEILNETYIGETTFLESNLDKFDRTKILIKARSENISDTYIYAFKTEDGKSEEKEISLTKHLEKTTIKKPETETISEGDFEIQLGYPTIGIEHDLEKEIVKSLKKINPENESEMKGHISTIFLINILKYIVSMKIKETTFGFGGLPVEQKIKIGSTLPSALVRKTTKTIDSVYAKAIEDVLSFKFKFKKEDYEGKININNTFFMT